jgi:hypothetical protein
LYVLGIQSVSGLPSETNSHLLDPVDMKSARRVLVSIIKKQLPPK